MSRDQPAEAPSSSAGGPPRLALSGSKPSWREREAMKAAGQAPPAASSAPAPAPAPAEPEPEAPKRSGYVPPALRSRGGDGSPAPSGWREREGSGRAPPGRTESPAAGGSGRWEPPSARGRFNDAGDKGRTQSPASGGYVPPGRRGADGGRGREGENEPRESLPPPSQAPSDGKYRPGAFRRGGAQ